MMISGRHGTAKMADFGLSITSSAAAKGLKVETISGTPGYACPIYARTGQVTEFSEARDSFQELLTICATICELCVL